MRKYHALQWNREGLKIDAKHSGKWTAALSGKGCELVCVAHVACLLRFETFGRAFMKILIVPKV